MTDASEQAYEHLRDFYSFFAPGARWSPRYKLYLMEKAAAARANDPDRKCAGWDGKIRLFQRGKIPAGLFRATLKDLKVSGMQLTIDREYPKLLDLAQGIDSDAEYEYQNTCTDAMIKALPRGGGIVLACTGAGKTKTAANFLSRLPYSSLFVVHRKNLLYQTQQELASWLNVPVGIVGDSVFDPQQITVAMIQTLHPHIYDQRFQKWFRKVRVVLVDELHKQMSNRNFDLLYKLKPIACYGLTATLEMGRKDVRFKAWSYAGPVVFRFPLAEGVKQKVVSKGKALQILFPEEYQWDQDTPDYHTEYEYEVIENELKLKTCKAHVEELIKRGRAVIVIVERVAHVQALHKMLAHIPHRLAYGKVRKVARDKAQRLFEKGKIDLIIANQVFKDGINIKRVSAIVDMAEWKSKSDTMQKYGRGVRLHQDKTDLVYVDYGTQTGRFAKAARSRKRALTQSEVPVQTVEIDSLKGARIALKRCLDATRA